MINEDRLVSVDGVKIEEEINCNCLEKEGYYSVENQQNGIEQGER